MNLTKRNFIKLLGLTSCGGVIPLRDVLTKCQSTGQELPRWLKVAGDACDRTSFIYPSFKHDLMLGKIDMRQLAVSVALIDYLPVYAESKHIAGYAYIDDLPEGAEVAVCDLLGNSVKDAAFDADDVKFAPVEVGRIVDYIMLYQMRSGGLIGCIGVGNGLPFLSDGGPVEIIWENQYPYIFRL